MSHRNNQTKNLLCVLRPAALLLLFAELRVSHVALQSEQYSKEHINKNRARRSMLPEFFPKHHNESIGS